MKISSLVPKVRFMLGNRSDIDDQIAMWIADAVLNLSINFPFSELQVYGETVQFIPNQSNYPLDYFMNCEADDLAFIDTWWYWYSGISGAGAVLKFRAPAVVTPLIQIGAGNPQYWSRFGNQVMVAQSPAQAFSTFWLYQRKHPLPDYANIPLLLDTSLKLPREWSQIIATVAAINGAADVEMTAKIPIWLKLLYGDPKTSGNPGFVKSLTSQYERDSARNERQISFVVE
jgi:hypothetical protein